MTALLRLLSFLFINVSLAGAATPLLYATQPAKEDRDEITVISPYDGINWESVQQYKSAFHVHVRTEFHPVSEVVRWHEEYGFDVFSLTEKNSHRSIASDIMLIIPAFESTTSREHRIGLFVDPDLGYDLDDVEQVGGVQWHAHPNDPGRASFELHEFSEMLDNYDSLIGFEIISRNHLPHPGRGDEIHDHRRGVGNYLRATKIWDKILKDYNMTDVYGVGVTDGYNDMTPEFRPDEKFYGESVYNTGWTAVLAEVREPEALRDALLSGQMFWVSNMDEGDPPMVTGIQVDDSGISLSIEGDYDEIKWIFDQQTIQTGETFHLNHLQPGQNYVRFEIWTNSDDFYTSDIVGSQPFTIRY